MDPVVLLLLWRNRPFKGGYGKALHSVPNDVFRHVCSFAFISPGIERVIPLYSKCDAECTMRDGSKRWEVGAITRYNHEMRVALVSFHSYPPSGDVWLGFDSIAPLHTHTTPLKPRLVLGGEFDVRLISMNWVRGVIIYIERCPIGRRLLFRCFSNPSLPPCRELVWMVDDNRINRVYIENGMNPKPSFPCLAMPGRYCNVITPKIDVSHFVSD